MSKPARTLRPPAWEPTDHEAYCWLKCMLPPPYRVTAEPQAGYFSEWRYHYIVWRADETIIEWTGDFRNLEAGRLAEEVRSFLRELETTPC